MSLRSASAPRIPRVWIAVAVATFILRPAPSSAQAYNVVHTFADPGGTNPNAALTKASDGNFYGTTLQGGAGDAGVLFRMTPSGTITVLHQFFANVNDGGFPAAHMIQATDGKLYGTTETGFNGQPGGTIFRLDPATGTYTPLFNLNGTSHGQDVYAPLTEGTDGFLYGTALFGGANGAGTAFRISTAGTSFAVLHSFNSASEGANPHGGLFQFTDGNFYGTTKAGGASGQGTVFRMTPAGAVTVLRHFAGGAGDGAAPVGPIMRASDGNMYGLTTQGGPPNGGAAYRITPGGAVSIIHFFSNPVEGFSPYGGFTQANDGNLYSTLFGGSNNWLGSVFQMTLGGAVSVIHPFGNVEGAYPWAGVVQGADGLLYGTTFYGGAYDAGALFKVGLNGANYQLLQSHFGSNDSGHTMAPMIVGNDGNLYGTGQAGGSQDGGSVFKMTPAGAASLVFSYNVHVEYGHPTTALVQATDGNFYIGTGSTLIRLTPSGQRTALKELDYWTEGYDPNSMIQASDGYLYGTTQFGGATGRGTIFRMSLSGQFSVIYTFPYLGGRQPRSIIQASDGNFYGTTLYGIGTPAGGYDAGTIYRMTPGGSVTILHALVPSSEGRNPWGKLIQASDGYIYGTTYSGGPSDCGSAWKMSPADGSFTVLHTFTTSEPCLIKAGLVQGADGNFYGGGVGGSIGYGGVFKMTPSGAVTTVHAFNGADGSSVYTELTAGPGRRVYGTTTLGGPTSPFGMGVVFQLSFSSASGDDFDGDGKGDITIYRPGTTTWWTLKSSTGYSVSTATANTVAGTNSSDIPVPGDYDGDGKTDLTVFRPSTGQWIVLQSSTGGVVVRSWGLSTDKLVPADYDGDGTTDIAVYRPSSGTWYILKSSANFSSAQFVQYHWGISSDQPAPGDYDGDGKADIAVFRPSNGTWYILLSSTNFTNYTVRQWGANGDIAVPGRFDSDGQTDMAVYRPSNATWYVLLSSNNSYLAVAWGAAGDIPVTFDFDGDGKTEIAVFRPSNGFWYIRPSTTGYTTFVSYNWGASSDVPVGHRP